MQVGIAMKKNILLRTILASAVVGACALMGDVAIAGDLGGRGSIKDAPAPYRAPRWTGFYVGGQVGYGEASYDGVFDSGEANPRERAFADDLDLSGAVGGIHVGYNLQSGNWVFGVEGDFNWTDWQDKSLDALPNAVTDFVTGNVEYLATIRGRLGYAVDRSLFYVTAGVAFADAEYTAVNGPNNSRGKLDFDDVGFVVGGGLEYALTDRISLRVQGLYYVFDDRKDGSRLNTDSDVGDFAKFEDVYSVTAGISFKF